MEKATRILNILVSLYQSLVAFVDEYEMEEQHWLQEQLKTVKNLADIALLIILNNQLDLLPTALELMLVEIQNIVDEQCVIGEVTNGKG